MSSYEKYSGEFYRTPSPELIVQSEENMKTWLAEVLDGQMYNQDIYLFDEQDLYAGDGSCLRNVFQDGLEHAEVLAVENNSFDFEARRRKAEMEEYEIMLEMAAGKAPNTMVVVSDFPAELMDLNEDLGGYNVTRKQTMLRVITRDDDGRITVRSQSLDQSHRPSLEELYKACEQEVHEGELLGQRMQFDLSSQGEQDDLIHSLRRVYDYSLNETYGNNWYAGRLHELGDITESTMDYVEEQKDILEDVRYKYGVLDFFDESDQQVLASVAATISERFDKDLTAKTKHVFPGSSQSIELQNVTPINLESEMWLATEKARSEGKTFSGCGSSFSLGETSMAESSMESHGFGNKVGKESLQSDQYGSLTFKCQKGHLNKRPRGKLIDCCKTCGIDVSC